MSIPAPSDPVELNTLDSLFSPGQAEIIEDTGWRPRRNALLRAALEARKATGRFIGIFSPSTLNFHGQTLLQVLGLEQVLNNLIHEHGVPRCPGCGSLARRTSLAGISMRWERFQTGTLMVAVKLEPEDRSTVSLLEILEYWGSQRIYDGRRILNVQQIQEERITTSLDLPLHVILDSASLPVAPGFETQFMTLLERTRASGGGSLSLLIREANREVTDLGDVSLGWFCPRCDVPLSAGGNGELFLGEVAAGSITSLTPAAVTDVLRSINVERDDVRAALELTGKAAACNLPLKTLVDQRPLSERFLIKLLSAVMFRLSDSFILVDDALEVFTPDQLELYHALVDSLTADRNQVLTLGCLTESHPSPPREENVFEGGLKITLDHGEVQVPQRGIVAIAGVELRELHSAAAELIKMKSVPWKEVSLLTVERLRAGSDKAVATELGLLTILLDILSASAGVRTAGFTASELKRSICPRCLGLGAGDDRHQGHGDCNCEIHSDRCRQLMLLEVKGEKLSKWCAAPLSDVQPLFAGYARASALLGALIATGLAGYTMNTPFQDIPDLHRQALRSLSSVAALEIDLYRRTSARREVPASLYLLEYPFLGFNRPLREQVMEALRHLILPDDTMGYTETVGRFNSAVSRAIVTPGDPHGTGETQSGKQPW